jgi:hypothetical protein
MRRLFDGNILESKSITIQEQPSQQLPEPSVPTPQITKPTAAAVTPKAPGFDGALAVVILSTINLLKGGTIESIGEGGR